VPTIILPQNVRLFELAWGNTLGRVDFFLKAGDAIEAGPIQMMHYDHKDQEAVSFQGADDKTYYILTSEIEKC
jgi:hypothetical protein